MNTRRSFLEHAAYLSALASLLPAEAQVEPANAKMQDFWKAYFDEAERTDDRPTRDASVQEVDPKKRVNFVNGTDKGLRFSSDISNNELFADDKDVVLTVNPGHFRPSSDDLKLIHKASGSHIRLDWFQKQPVMSLVAPMAWAGLAVWTMSKINASASTSTSSSSSNSTSHSLTSGSASPAASAAPKPYTGPLPPKLTDLDFRDPNAPDAPASNQVILMGGTGKVAVQATAMRVNDKLQAVLSHSVQYASIVAPYFGFAPLAVPALRAFTDVFGYFYHHESILMNSLPVELVASQHGKAIPGAVSRVNMVSGDYLAVPAHHADELKDSMDQLRIDQGWLVHQDANKSQTLEMRAQDPKVPNITYISMSVTVESLGDVQKRKAAGG